jgi:hypothetical protein
MLWWGYFEKTKTVGKTEKREKENASSGKCRDSSGSVYGGFEVE